MDYEQLDDTGLARLVANCIFEMTRGGRFASTALVTVNNVYPEISRRYSGKGDKGLLAALGYRVGHAQGLDVGRRQAILAFVYNYPLPLIRNSEYMIEWGEPKTSRRLSKIVSVIQFFIQESGDEPTHSRARAEWLADLEYLQGADFKVVGLN